MKKKASEYFGCRQTVIKEDDGGHAIVEIDGLYYIVQVDSDAGEVLSVLPADNPKNGGRWASKPSESGIKYVAKGRKLQAALSQWRRHIAPLSK